MQKTKISKKVIAAAGIASIALLAGTSFAYFSDYATTKATGTAGTVAVEINSMINLLDEDGYDILGPGDVRDAMFEVVNMGNKSIDVRTTLALTIDSEHYDLAFSGDNVTQSEYDLYPSNGVTFTDAVGAVPLAFSDDFAYNGATGEEAIAAYATDYTKGTVDTALITAGSVTETQPVQIKSIQDNVIYYEIPDYSLSGNSDKYNEVETVNGVGTYKNLYDYVLVFKNTTGNDWQDSTIAIDIIVEAKQHENTGAGWDIVAQETITQGSITKSVVKGEDVLTN